MKKNTQHKCSFILKTKNRNCSRNGIYLQTDNKLYCKQHYNIKETPSPTYEDFLKLSTNKEEVVFRVSPDDKRLTRSCSFDVILSVLDCWNILEYYLRIGDIATLMLVNTKMLTFLQKEYIKNNEKLWISQFNNFVEKRHKNWYSLPYEGIEEFPEIKIIPLPIQVINILLVNISDIEIENKLTELCIKNGIRYLTIYVSKNPGQLTGTKVYRENENVTIQVSKFFHNGPLSHVNLSINRRL
jgi:hypothetical protein